MEDDNKLEDDELITISIDNIITHDADGEIPSSRIIRDRDNDEVSATIVDDEYSLYFDQPNLYSS